MDDLDARTLAHIRAAGYPMSDLPDEAILKTYTFAWVRLGVAMREFGAAMLAPLRGFLERRAH